MESAPTTSKRGLTENFETVKKVVRPIKKADSPIFQGAQIYPNFIKPHMSLSTSECAY
jgi:hypothetical protein